MFVNVVSISFIVIDFHQISSEKRWETSVFHFPKTSREEGPGQTCTDLAEHFTDRRSLIDLDRPTRDFPSEEYSWITMQNSAEKN